MTRPVGKATWERGGGAPMSWMDTERARGREGAGWGHPVFRAVEAALWAWPERRRSRLPRRPPFHILQRRRGQPHRRFFTRCCGYRSENDFSLHGAYSPMTINHGLLIQ